MAQVGTLLLLLLLNSFWKTFLKSFLRIQVSNIYIYIFSCVLVTIERPKQITNLNKTFLGKNVEMNQRAKNSEECNQCPSSSPGNPIPEKIYSYDISLYAKLWGFI